MPCVIVTSRRGEKALVYDTLLHARDHPGATGVILRYNTITSAIQATMKPIRSNPNTSDSTPQSASGVFRRSLALSILAPAMIALVLVLPACKGGGAADAKASQASSKSDDKDKDVAKDGKDGKKEDTAVPVEVAKVSRRPVAASYSGTASLDAPGEAQVVSKTSGIVLQILTEEGQRVTKGQVLARLDSEHQRLQVMQAESAERKLEANYARSQKMVAAKLVSTEANDRSSTTSTAPATHSTSRSSNCPTPTSPRRFPVSSPSAWSRRAT